MKTTPQRPATCRLPLITFLGLLLLVVLNHYSTQTVLFDDKVSQTYETTTLVPMRYDLDLSLQHPNRGYSGLVNISILSKGTFRKLTLDASGLTILSARIDEQDAIVKKGSDEIHLLVEQPVEKGNHSVVITWKGIVGDFPIGFFKSKLDQGDWLAATHFEPNFASKAFPCFDNPTMKAVFSLKLTHASQYQALSNTPLESSLVKDKMTTSIFKPTVPLSTYLVAWTLFPRYEFVSKIASNGLLVRAFAPPGQTDLVTFSLDVAVRCVELYEKLLKVPLPIPKLDFFPLPDFPAEGMENMGLVTMEDTGLFRKDTDDLERKQYTALLVSHEIAHHWFGNLVTMADWDDLWLNEGFAEFMQFVTCNMLYPEWDLEPLFFEMEQRLGFLADASSFTHAVHPPKENMTFFDDITYNKGASLLRMFAHIVDLHSDGGFFEILGKYIKGNLYGVVTTRSILKAFDELLSPIELSPIM